MQLFAFTRLRRTGPAGALWFFLILSANLAAVQLDPPGVTHTPPSKLAYPGTTDFRIKVPGRVRAVRFFFFRPGFDTPQLRIMKQEEDGSYRYALNTSTLQTSEFKYYFEIQAEGKTFFYPEKGPREPLEILSKKVAYVPAAASAQAPGQPAQAPPTQAAAKESSPLQLQLAASIPHQLTSSGEPQAPFSNDRKTVADGNIGISKTFRRNDMQIQFDSNIQLTNHPAPGDDDLYLNNLSLGFQYQNHSLRMGDVKVQASPLTLQGYGRRGAEYQFDGKTVTFQLFNISAQQMRGWGGLIPSSDLGLFGGKVGLNLLNGALTIGTLYLTGRDDPSLGRNVAGAGLAKRQGNVISVFPQLRLLKSKVNIFGEYAFSSIDRDLSDAEGRKSDNAFRFGSDVKLGVFSFGGVYRNVGTEYDSIGNPSNLMFNNDRRGYELYTRMGLKGVRLDMQYFDEKDNVTDDPLRPTSDYKRTQASLSLIPASYLSLFLSYGVLDQVTEDGQGILQEKKAENVMGGVNVTVSRSASFRLSAGRSAIKNPAQPQMDSTALTVSTGGMFRIGDAVRIFPSLNYSRSRRTMDGTQTNILNGFINAEVFLVKRILSLSTLSSFTSMDLDLNSTTKNLNLTGSLNLYFGWLAEKLSKASLSLRSGLLRIIRNGQIDDSFNVRAQFDYSF